MKKRTKRLTAQWALAAQRLAQKLGGARRDQKQVPYPLCALKELSSESLGRELRASGCQVDTGSTLTKVLLHLLEFEPRAGGGRVWIDACGSPGPFHLWGRVTPPPP